MDNFIAILINIREVVKLNDSWDEDVDNVEELHKLLVPILVKALDYDIQEAATNCVSAVQSGKLTNHSSDTNEITPKPKQPLTNEDVKITVYFYCLENLLTFGFLNRFLFKMSKIDFPLHNLLWNY